MRANYKNKIVSKDEIKQFADKAVERAYNECIDKVYAEVRRDVAAQIMAVCCCELHTEFGFGKKRLKRFHRGICDLLRLMESGVMNKNFSPVECIELLKNKYGIDLDKDE